MKQFYLVLGLVVSTWAYADVPKTLQTATTTVLVDAEGTSIDDARRAGYKIAIEQVVGSVIVSEQEVKGDQLTRNRTYMP